MSGRPVRPRGISPAELAARLAARPRLLVFDFDGTLAYFAERPEEARLPPGTRRRLAELAGLPQTTVAVLSGRGLASLRAKVGLDGLVLVGNHGLSSDRPGLAAGGRRIELWRAAVREAVARLAPIVVEFEGALLEAKDLDLSLHFRLVRPELAGRLLRRAARALDGLPLEPAKGSRVLEFRPRGAGGKGRALVRLARLLEPGWRRSGVCLFAGDDRSDEDAFAALDRLGPRAVGVKVGSGRSAADFRLDGPAEIGKLLAMLVKGG